MAPPAKPLPRVWKERVARSVDANYVTIILTACGEAAVDAAMQQRLIDDVHVLLAKKGNLEESEKVLVSLPRRADVVTHAAALDGKDHARCFVYTTDAMLLSMLRHDPLLNDYVAVVAENVQHKDKLVERLTHAVRERGRLAPDGGASKPKLRMAVFDSSDDATKATKRLTSLFQGLSVSVVDCSALTSASSTSASSFSNTASSHPSTSSSTSSSDSITGSSSSSQASTRNKSFKLSLKSNENIVENTLSNKTKKRERTSSSVQPHQQLSLAEEDADPLDAEDRRGVHSAERNAWAAKWSSFPLYAMKDKLRALTESFRTNQVTIVISGTGSGKTVLAPPLMLKLLQTSSVSVQDGQMAASSRVAVTIPKRATVLAAAQTGAKTLDVVLGEEVGYQFRGEKHFDENSKRSALLYTTDGTLLARSRRDGDLEEFGAVLVDEAHERPVPTDLLLAVLRSAVVKRPAFRVVVMSATIDPAEFVRYFAASSGPPSPGSSTARVGVVHIAGNPMHPIERRFLYAGDQGPPSEYLEDGIRVVKKILLDEKGKSGNVLMFVPLTKDTAAGCKLLRDGGDNDTAASSSLDGGKRDKVTRGKGARKGFEGAGQCVTLYGKMSAEERDAAIGSSASSNENGKDEKKVFIATNVAESSLTLPGLTHVVDSGLQLASSWNAARRCTRIAREMASQAQITQRIGRVGRTEPGVAHLLYSASRLAQQKLYPQPTILTVDMSEYMLSFLEARKNLTTRKTRATRRRMR